jgi:hypothetical protein
MLKRILFLVAMLISPLSIVIAGTISNGVWLPSACGAEPSPPVFKQKSIEEYNDSVKLINEWQLKANAYNNCLIKEANIDNALIAKSANEQQSKLRLAFDNIKSFTDAAKAKLDKE